MHGEQYRREIRGYVWKNSSASYPSSTRRTGIFSVIGLFYDDGCVEDLGLCMVQSLACSRTGFETDRVWSPEVKQTNNQTVTETGQIGDWTFELVTDSEDSS